MRAFEPLGDILLSQPGAVQIGTMTVTSLPQIAALRKDCWITSSAWASADGGRRDRCRVQSAFHLGPNHGLDS